MKTWTFSSDALLVGTYGNERDDSPTIEQLGIIVYKPQKCEDGVVIETGDEPEEDEFGYVNTEESRDAIQDFIDENVFLQKYDDPK